ncbi:hypothetical protein FRB95_012039 [Tulasnella sp. JGI-2019a]|nr:hypothetical protein FRB95_012039 [Tulasnella sp. JGI-2019a]
MSPSRKPVEPADVPLPNSPTSPSGRVEFPENAAVALLHAFINSGGPAVNSVLSPGDDIVLNIGRNRLDLQEDDIAEGKLRPSELPWCSRYEFLKSRGYLLRPRYRPGWQASWLSQKSGYGAEDAIILSRPHLLDATRVSDGKVVYLKSTLRSSPEIRIGEFLWSEQLRNDPCNHAIPLLEVLDDPDDSDLVILVIPLLRRLDSPRPASVREVVSLVEQTLEGLSFLHEHGIAHRDCAWGNIMMDARGMFPGGWHPQSGSRLPNGQRLSNHQTASRTAAGGVRYYFIDFGISTQDQDETIGTSGQEHAPELSLDVPYNPYKLDVYIMGRMYQQFILQECSGAEFLKPLIDYMTPEAPGDRPTAEEASQRFKTMRANMTGSQLSQRLRPTLPEPTAIRIFKDAYYRMCDRWWTLIPKRKLPPLA